MWDEFLALADYLRRDTILFIGLITSLIIPKSRDFMKTWGPFLFLWIVYDMMRGVADNLGPVHVKEVYDLEIRLFGWLFDGRIPAFWMKDHMNVWLDSFTAIVYTLHPMVPIFVGIMIYYVSKDKEMFKEYSWSFLLMVYSALITFALYPVAPPWYVSRSGFAQPEQRTGLAESAAGLVNFDNFFRTDFYGTVYQTFNANPFAAMPSLHSGFSVICVYFFIKMYKEKTPLVWLTVLYPTAVWFSAVYLQHHYIVDLIAGAIYAIGSAMIVARFLEYRRSKQAESENEVIGELEDDTLEEDKTNGNSELEEMEEENVISIPIEKTQGD